MYYGSCYRHVHSAKPPSLPNPAPISFLGAEGVASGATTGEKVPLPAHPWFCWLYICVIHQGWIEDLGKLRCSCAVTQWRSLKIGSLSYLDSSTSF